MLGAILVAVAALVVIVPVAALLWRWRHALIGWAMRRVPAVVDVLRHRLAPRLKPLLPKLFLFLRAWLLWPRRFLSRTIYAQTIGFPDSHLALGEEEVQLHEPELIARTLTILERRHRRDYPEGVRPMPRDFHGKQHACLSATFEVLPNLPAEVRFGVFGTPGGVPLRAVMRFSNATREQGSDRMPNQRGLAIKVVLGDTPGAPHQDFLLSDYPVNFVSNPAEAFAFYRAEAADKPLAFLLRHPTKFALAMLGSTLNQQKDLFDLRYHSQTPYRLGPGGACKYTVRPLHPPSANAGPGAASDDDSVNYFREIMAARLRAVPSEPAAPPSSALRPGELVFQLCIQPQRHPVRQPVEDASIEWDEDEAKPIPVATLRILPGQDKTYRSPELAWHGELLSFNPEHAHPELRPIGGLNRVRRAVYQKFAEMRFRANGVAERRGADAVAPTELPPTPLPHAGPRATSTDAN